jgi:hypothetical protein
MEKYKKLKKNKINSIPFLKKAVFLHKTIINYIKSMATITLEYNSRDIQAKKTLDYILSMGFFKTSANKSVVKKNGIEQALEDVRKGRVYTYNSVEDLLEEINS